MTIAEKKEWLNRYRKSVRRANEIANQIAEYSYIKGIKYKAVSTRNGSRYDLAVDVINLDELKQNHLTACMESLKIYREVLDAIKTLDDADDPEGWLIVFMRHLRLKQFEDIAASTGRSKTTVYRIYARALMELEIT